MDALESLKCYKNDKRHFSADVFWENQKDFILLLEELGYGESMLATAKNSLNLLFLFRICTILSIIGLL